MPPYHEEPYFNDELFQDTYRSGNAAAITVVSALMGIGFLVGLVVGVWLG